MRRLFRVLLPAAAAVCLLWVSALAAGSAQMVRAFVYDGTLYTYVELTDVDSPITQAQAKARGYLLAEGCEAPLTAYFARRQAEDAAKAGNGRLARNVLERAILNQGKRLIADPAADLALLLPDDFELE